MKEQTAKENNGGYVFLTRNDIHSKKDYKYYNELCYYFVSRILPLKQFPQPDEDAVSYLPKRSDRYLRFLATDLRDAPETARDLDEILTEMYLFDMLQRKTKDAEIFLKNLVGVPVKEIAAKKKLTKKELKEAAFDKITPKYGLPTRREFKRQMKFIADKMDKAEREDPVIPYAVSLLVYFKKYEDTSEEEFKIYDRVLDEAIPAICRMSCDKRKEVENYANKIFDLERFSKSFTEDSFAGEDVKRALKEVASDEFYEKVSLIQSRYPAKEDAQKAVDIVADMSLSTQTEIEHCVHLYKLIFSLYTRQRSYARGKDEIDKKMRAAEEAIRRSENKDKEIAKTKEENESLRWQLSDLKKQLEKKTRTIEHLNKDIDNIVSAADKEETDKESIEEIPETEEEIEEEIKKTEEMARSLKKMKIAVVGGADSLTGKLRSYFPDWLYIDAHGSAAKEQIAGKDCVVVMIGYLCHGTMWGIKKHAEECGVPMCYVMGTNIDRVIRNIYEGINGALKENAA